MTGLEFFIPIVKFLASSYTAPLWGAISAVAALTINHIYNKNKLKLEKNKDVREDFQVIKESLYEEIERLKVTQEETKQSLIEAEEETKKCERRYYELAVQYKELLAYCAALATEFRKLEQRVANMHTNDTNGNKR